MNLRYLIFCILAFVALPGASEEHKPTVFMKLSPGDMIVGSAGVPLELLAVNRNYRAYTMPPGTHRIRLSADGYTSKTLLLDVLDGILVEEKLERAGSTLRLQGEYSTGRQPKSAEFSPDGRHLVVPLLGDRGIVLYSAEPFEYEMTLPVPEPYASQYGFVESAFVPRTGELWVSQMTAGVVHVFDTVTWEWKGAYDTGGTWPKVITVSPDGRTCCVSNWISKTVSFLDSETGRILEKVLLGGIPRGMIFNRDGTRLYVCLFDTGNIEVIDCRRHAVVETLHLGPGAARHIVSDRTHETMYVTDMYNGTVVSLSMATGAVLQKRYVGANPNTLALTPDGSRVLVSVRGRNNRDTYLREGPEYGRIVMLDAETLDIVDWTWGRNQPTGLAVSPDGRIFAFTDFLDASVEVYRLSEPIGH